MSFDNLGCTISGPCDKVTLLSTGDELLLFAYELKASHCYHTANLGVNTFFRSQVASLSCEEFDVFSTTSCKLCIILPDSIKYFAGVNLSIAKHSFVYPIVNSDRMIVVLTD